MIVDIALIYPFYSSKYKLVESASLSRAKNICLRKGYRGVKTVTVSDILNDESLDKMIAHDDALKIPKDYPVLSYNLAKETERNDVYDKTARMSF